MMKSYAKKREAVHAAQWTGEMTPAMTALVGERKISIDSDRQLVFANEKGCGRFARVGDWIVSFSGEDLTVVGDDQFGKTYEEVDETGRPMPSSDAEHEAAGQEFVRALDVLLIAGLKLSRAEHPSIFHERDRLMSTLRYLFEDQAYTAARRERHQIRDKIAKDLTP